MKIEFEIECPPLFQLSSHQDLILFLIKKELQGTKFVSELSKIGFDSSIFDIDLGAVILSLLGFKRRTDEWQWYYEKLDDFAEKVDLQDNSIVSEMAFSFYLELQSKVQSEVADGV